MPGPDIGQGVAHRVDNGRSDRRVAHIAGALGPERIGRCGRDHSIGLERRHVGGSRHRISEETVGHDLPVAVVYRLLEKSLAHAEGDVAMRLAVHHHGVAYVAEVVDCHVADEVDMAGLFIYLDQGSVGAGGEVEIRWIDVRDDLQPRLDALRQVPGEP
jgi:hypothetical protein